MATQASDSIKQRARITTADELAVVVQRAQAFTNASGAAIAIGNSEELVCRARSGSSAPDVGTAMRVEGSFTGLCIQTGKELRCDDAETDTRVDTAALRSLGIRSLVVTPIKDEGKVIGVLAVFAPTPHAFTITHVAVLKTMADQISTLLQKERRSPREEAHVEAPVAPTKPAVAPAPLPPVVIRPSAAPSAVGAAAAPARTNGSSVPVAEPLRPVAIATEIAPVPFPKREEKREPKRFEPKPDTVSTPKTSFAMLDAVAGEPRRSSSGKFILMGGLAVVIAGAAVGWMLVARHKANSSAANQSAQQPQTTAAATQPAPSSTATPSASSPAAPVVTPAAKTNTPEKPDGKKIESQKNDKQNKSATSPAPATVELASGPSRITGKAPVDQSPDVAPSLTVGSTGSSTLTSLAKPVGNSAPSILTQSELVNAKAIRAVPAIYPEIAKARRISGSAVVRVTVGKDGKVSNPKFISGPMVFRDSSFDAVKQWLFQPATLNGQAIEQETEITVKFKPN
ncbi:MAG TPA: TonB family protein [Candidatus Angelobacter sp.]